MLLRLLKEQGYAAGIALITHYVKPRQPPRQAPAVQRYETKPGYQAQVDWKICEYIDVDGEVPLSIRHSRLQTQVGSRYPGHCVGASIPYR